jgi:uncharacterized membrane protein YhaH (DUF805 family)
LRFWLRIAYAQMVFLVLGIFAMTQGYVWAGYLAVTALTLVTLALIPISVRRLHDRGYTGWLFLIAAFLFLVQLISSRISTPSSLLFILGIFQVWLTVQMFFLRGRAGGNRYGGDPLAEEAADPVAGMGNLAPR